ncbi:MAG: histidine kinase N-terminal 7TM domain-containing protein [Actinomycetota bacterium]|nr:histidine kinase N-terminal 7TM domain-containing protein [Actinomycetota bacterium]
MFDFEILKYIKLIIPLLIGIITSAVSIFYLLKHKSFSKYKVGILLFGGFLIWLTGFTLELFMTDFYGKVLLSKIEYIGVVIIPVAFFVLALEFSGYPNWLTSKKAILISSISIIVLVLTATNEFHGLIWSEIDENIMIGSQLKIIKYGYGFWIWVIYAYSLIAISYFLLIKSLLNKFKLFKIQSMLLIIVVTAPFMANLLYITKVINIPNYDITPLALVFSSVVLIHGFAVLKIGNVIPIIYNSQIDSLKEPVIILDNKDRIQFINRSGQRIFKKDSQKVIGKSFYAIAHSYFNNYEKLIDKFDIFEMENILKDKPDSIYKVRINPYLDNNKKLMGKKIIFEDITERKIAEKQIRESEEKFKSIYLSSPIGIAILNQNGHINEANKSCLEILGAQEVGQIENVNFCDLFKLSLNFIEKVFENKIIIREIDFDFDKIKCEKIYPTTRKGKAVLNISFIKFNLSTGDFFKHCLLQIEDITERKEHEEKIKYLNFHDKLTGLFNRTYFEEEIKRLDTKRQLPISIVVGDVNGLKLINDSYSYEKGDMLLKKVALKLKEKFRQEDIIARWGEDEFIILLPLTPLETALEIIDRVRVSCENDKIFNIPLSISLGAFTKTDESQDINNVVKEAEDRMYRRKLMEKESAHNSIIVSLEKALEERDYETSEHIKRIRYYALKLGESLGLPENKLDEISLLATLHDIGKIAITDNIILKPGPLTPEEWAIIQKHPEIGYRIATSSIELLVIAEGILAHHERWDGKGYPKGISGDQIPIIARIITIVDSFDAMISDRPYRKALGIDEAISELKRCSGTQFDPVIAKKFINILSKKNQI